MERFSDVANGYAGGLSGALGAQHVPPRFNSGQLTTGPQPPGLGQATDALNESTVSLHQMISELEAVLENAGLLQAAPPMPSGVGAAANAAQRARVSDMVRASTETVRMAIDRLRVLRDRVDV